MEEEGNEKLNKAFEELISKMFTKEELQVMELEHKKWLEKKAKEEEDGSKTA
jgi:hypothetical protein